MNHPYRQPFWKETNLDFDFFFFTN